MRYTQDQSLPLDVYIPHFGKETKLIGVEIGTGGAIGAFHLLYYLPNLTLYTIDPWKHIDGALYEAGMKQEDLDEGFRVSTERLKPYSERCYIIRKRSDEAVNDIPNELDFVHIDGDHSYEQVVRDIKNYMPKIKKNGILSGHDYLLQVGVVKAVDEFFGQSVSFADDFVWWVKL